MIENPNRNTAKRRVVKYFTEVVKNRTATPEFYSIAVLDCGHEHVSTGMKRKTVNCAICDADKRLGL